MYSLKHKSIKEMTEILEERGLVVDDATIFEEINYAHLIYKYSRAFYAEEPNYKVGTKLSDIYNLYLFNQRLSQFLYKAIWNFEHKLKREIASQATEDSAFEYLDKTFYGDVKRLKYFNQKEFDDFLKNIKITHTNAFSNNPYLKNKTVNNVMPLWIFVDELSIGQLRMFLKYWKRSGKIFGKLSTTWKELSLINEYRNVIFHMNPLKPRIKKGKKTFLLTKFLKVLNKTMNDKELESFWNDFSFLINKELTNSKYHKIFQVVIN